MTGPRPCWLLRCWQYQRARHRRRRKIKRLRIRVDRLPLLTREIFLLHRVDGVPVAAIVLRLGMDESQVDRALVDALIALATDH